MFPPSPQQPPFGMVPPIGSAYPSMGPARIAQTAEVKLEISAKNIRDRDVMSKSDPICVVFLEDKSRAPDGYPGSGPMSAPLPAPGQAPLSEGKHSKGDARMDTRWREIGRTESIKDNLNPHFSVQITVPYRFEELQNIRIGLWDIDTKQKELITHDFLGDVRTTVGDLVSAGEWTGKLTYPRAKDMKKLLGGIHDLGTITIIVHENRDGGKMHVRMNLSGQKLDKMDLFRSDPYLIITQIGGRSGLSRSQLYTSEVVKKNLNPTWRPIQFVCDIPKGGDKSHIKLEFLCNDKDQHSRDDEIGIATHSLQALEGVSSVPLINTRKKRNRPRYKNSGTLKIDHLRAIRMPSLIEYLQGGLKLHFSVAIDLTASNGDPRDPRSLHYRRDAYSGNHYINALSAIADVLRVYTPSDNMFAAYGFGAELPSQRGTASSCFPLSMGADPHCVGVEGILGAYAHTLNSVVFSGPTNFAPLINTVTRMAAQRSNTQQNQNVSVLIFDVHFRQRVGCFL